MSKISKKKKIYSVKLAAIGDNEVSVMKAYRDLTGLGLKEVKDKVNSAPCVLLETNSRREADSSNKLKKIGIDFSYDDADMCLESISDKSIKKFHTGLGVVFAVAGFVILISLII